MLMQSQFLRWPNNKNSAKRLEEKPTSNEVKQTKTRSRQKKGGNRNWIHPPEALKGGHVAYLVKFLGSTEVEKPKGIEVVKEGIRKLKFNQYLKRSEGSTKIPKVELTISIDGVAIQDPKSRPNLQIISHQYPLHRISYCADDKSDKKFFSFIAKEPEASDNKLHRCFVFVSDKLAEEITLTIGQAFDLAYRRFLDTSGRDLEMRKQIMVLQKRVKELETENKNLKQKLTGAKSDEQPSRKKGSNNLIAELNTNINNNHNSAKTNGSIPLLQPPPASLHRHHTNNNSIINNGQDLLGSSPILSKKLDPLILDEDFNPRSLDGSAPNTISNGHGSGSKDLFGAEPFVPLTGSKQPDPFEMGEFCGSDMDLDNAIGAIDKKLSEMRAGFSQGLSFGNDDFVVEDNNKGS